MKGTLAQRLMTAAVIKDKPLRVPATHLNELIDFVCEGVKYTVNHIPPSQETATLLIDTYNAMIGLIKGIKQGKGLIEMMQPYDTLTKKIDKLVEQMDKTAQPPSYRERAHALYTSCEIRDVVHVRADTIILEPLRATRQSIIDYGRKAGINVKIIPPKQIVA